ncbi:SWIM zinc finger family protein [Parablautia muri]|uniref:SWIM-type domain-containing protein n=1 Tax=Parablautia muri TaxID=2320879 RepID=A0A9X5BF97_9FIRM|nr:SWIM zinc finger family protein [Parablautia muri]NBJ92718.1 hypothetical protein [Parablautia muri]
MNWQKHFMQHILDRGYDYFCEGAVEDMACQDNVIRATVCGTEDYEVEITLEDGGIEDMYCNCPYAQAGSYCKHMAAVLFEWESGLEDGENGKQVKENEGDDSLERKMGEDEEWDEIKKIVSQADETLVRNFLAEILQKDEKLFARFKTSVSPEISIADMKRYKAQVDTSIQKYLGRDHFISYYEAYGFIREMEEYLYEDVAMMIDEGCYLNAFELTGYIFVKVGNVDMDDSDGGMGMLAEHCKEIWEEILELADDNEKQAIYEWFTKHLDGSVIDYMEEYIEQVLMENFKEKKFQESKLVYSDQKVKEAKQNTDSTYERYYAEKWALCHINLMEENGFDPEEVLWYCKENWKYAGVRKFYITRCIEKERYEEAIEALKESLQIDADMPGLVREFSAKLKDIYFAAGRKEEYRQQLWNLVTKDNPGNVEEFKELRGLYSQEEWESIREKIFAQIPACARVERLYKEEKLYDRLLEHVLRARGLFVLQEYENVLMEDYPEEILQKYADEVNEMARRTADRKRYKEWVGILRRMRRIKGGEAKVHEITENWKVMYGNRSAMMDELEKL